MNFCIAFLLAAMVLASCQGATVLIEKRQLPLPFPLPIPDVLGLGVCRDTALPSTLLSAAQFLQSVPMPAAQYLQIIKKVMDTVPYRPATVNADNLKTMSQLYRFGMFCGLSYCGSQQEMDNIAKVSVNKNNTLYMGRFKVLAVRDLAANRYIITADEQLKQIVVTWRGTDNLNNLLTDLDGAPVINLPGQSYPLKNAKSQKPGNTQFFRGFVASLSLDIMNTFDSDLKQAMKANAGYQLIFAGHSLGGAQTVLAALHWHLTQQQPQITAIYTFGMPILGNNEANGWVASELQSYNWVRAVSRGDLVPWGRVKESAQFSGDLEEVFLPESKEAITSPVTCKGQMDTKCSAGIPCEQKQWVDHVWVAGININPLQFCVLGRHPSLQQSSSNNST